VLLLCQQAGCLIELSPARYQLIQELKLCGYAVYVFFQGTISDKKIRSEIYRAVNTRNLSVRDIRNEILKILPDCVIAFTYEDTSIIYSLPFKLRKTSFIYYNLEIYTPIMEQNVQTEGSFYKIRCLIMYALNKIKEIIFIKQCKLFVIQDSLRKRTAAKYWLWHSNTMLIPNTYVFQNENRVKNGCQGIIYSGGLTKVQVESLIKGLFVLSDLPITFSGWSDDWFRAQYKKLRKTHSGVKLCNVILSPEKFTDFLKEYAVGLIWYSITKDENINNIGMSSGKFFRHLSLGQPVIVNDCPGISKVVNKYKLGVVVQDASEIKEAYERIMEKYSEYQKNIIEVYKTKFDYAKRIRPFLKQLKEI